MTKFTFYGCSDDLFMCDKDGKTVEEIYPPQQYMIKDGDDAMVVTAHYGDRAGVWSVGVEPFDEDVPIPGWPTEFALSERGYSAVLCIDAPDSAKLFVANNDD